MDYVQIASQLLVAALLPVVASIVFYFAEKRTAYGKLSYWTRQIITGIV